MHASIVEMTLDEDSTILVEIETARPVGLQNTSGADKSVNRRVAASVDAVMATAMRLGRMASNSLKAELADDLPSSYEVSFGVKVSAEGNAVVAKASTDANFTITLTWKKP